MLSFEILDDLAGVKNFIEGMNTLPLAASLGVFESLVSHPYTMTHGNLTPDQKKEIGISESLIRISAGLENTEDLLKSVNRGLNKI